MMRPDETEESLARAEALEQVRVWAHRWDATLHRTAREELQATLQTAQDARRLAPAGRRCIRCLAPCAHRGSDLCSRYTAGELAYSPVSAGEDRQAGLYWSARCQTTRAGQTFGASQSERLFDSEAERDAYVAKRLADAQKRAPKAATSGRSARTDQTARTTG